MYVESTGRYMLDFATLQSPVMPSITKELTGKCKVSFLSLTL